MPQLLDINHMLPAANAAILQTRKLLTNGNSNAYGGIPGTRFRATSVNQQNCIREAVAEAYATDNVGIRDLAPDPIKVTLCDAKIAIGQKAGNCDQFASVAFAYLFVHGYWPFHKCHIPGHAFVVLGYRDAFVICDPWADKYCANTSVNEWLAHIWGDTPPAWDTRQVDATWQSEGGSETRFNQLTALQTTIDKMDFSE